MNIAVSSQTERRGEFLCQPKKRKSKPATAAVAVHAESPTAAAAAKRAAERGVVAAARAKEGASPAAVKRVVREAERVCWFSTPQGRAHVQLGRRV